MIIAYLLFRIFAEDGHSGGYSGILSRYEVLLQDHEQCVEALAESQAAVKNYENLIINGLQKQVDILKKELIDVVSEQKDIRKSVTDMKVKDESLEENIDAIKKDYDLLKENASSYFSAKTYQAPPLNSPIPFPVSMSEHNSGFDGNKGIMTVKIPGTYFWSCQFLTHHYYVHFVLVHSNGECDNDIVEAHNNRKDGHYMVSLMSTLNLKKDDKVWVEMRSGKTWSGNAEYNQCTAFKIA